MKKLKIILLVLLIGIALVLFVLVLKNKAFNDSELVCNNITARETNNVYCNNNDIVIQNGSFDEISEDEYQNTIIDYWQTDDEEQNLYLIDSNDGEYECYDGEYCLDINTFEENKIYTEIEVNSTGNKNIAFNYYPVEENASFNVGIIEKDEAGIVINEYEDTVDTTEIFEWSEYQNKFVIADNTKTIELYFSTDNNEEIWGENVLVDNVQVGNDPVYDIASTIEEDEGYLTLVNNVNLISGIPLDTSLTTEVGLDVEIFEITVNGKILEESDINVDKEIDNEEVEKTIIQISNLPKVSNIEIRIKLNFNSLSMSNSNYLIYSNLDYNQYYVMDDAIINTDFPSEIAIYQEVQDQSADGIADQNEILKYIITLDNTESNYNEYNIFINLNSNYNEYLTKFTINGVKMYDSSHTELTNDKYEFNSDEKIIKIPEIPKGEKYTIEYEYYVNQYDNDIEELENTINYKSKNIDSEQEVTTIIPLNTLNNKIYIDSSLISSGNEDYTISINIVGNQNGYINHNLEIYFYSEIIKKYYLETLIISSDSKILIEGEDYQIDENKVKIYEVEPNENIEVTIKVKLKRKLNNEDVINIVYKTDETYNNEQYEWLWKDTKII